jgi:hypothetical protein
MNSGNGAALLQNESIIVEPSLELRAVSNEARPRRCLPFILGKGKRHLRRSGYGRQPGNCRKQKPERASGTASNIHSNVSPAQFIGGDPEKL